MKHLLLICVSFFALTAVVAQTPQYVPYQAVARDAAGNLLVNQNVSLRFTVHQSTGTGTTQYQETQSATTNKLGLFSVNIGSGTLVSGSFNGITWADGQPKFMQVEIDPTGGNSYTNMGASQMMSVPFALYAGSAASSGGPAGGDLTGTYPNPSLIATGTAGTYTKVTTDSKGRVTAGTNLSASDVPAGNNNYIQNGTSVQSPANFNISGNGTIGGTATVNGEVIGTLGSGSGQFRAVDGSYGAFIRNDGANTYMPLLTASGNPYGGWNSLRPLYVNDATGDLYMANATVYIQHSTGDVGIGITTPTAQLHTTGTVRFANYANGILGTDGSGNLQPLTVVTNNANQVDIANGNGVSGNPAISIDNAYTESIKAGLILSGGGNVTYSGGNLSWSARFIVINNGTGSQFSTSGYFDISQPPNGTVITGVGAAGNVTANASGVPVGCWQALYYILPIGGNNGVIYSNYRIVQYNANFVVPENWVLIAAENCDDATIRIGNGTVLQAGQTWTSGQGMAQNSGSGNYIQNQYSSAQSANSWISGSSQAGEVYSSGEVYVQNWFRNNVAGTGLYNQATGSGIYSPSAGLMTLYNNSSLEITSASTGSGNLRFDAANPYITASSYFIAPGGAYFNGGTVYVQNGFEARGGVSNDNGSTLVLNGGTSGCTQWANSYLQNDQGGTIELGGNNGTAGVGTPYIDFHTSGGGSLDYSIRQIAVNNYRMDWDQTGYSGTYAGLGASLDMTTGRAAGFDLSLWTIYATRYGGYYDIMNDLDSIDHIRPIKWINPKTNESETVTDVSTMPRDTKLKAADGTYLTDVVNASYLNTGAIRQLRAETKSRDEMLESRITRLEGLVSQLSGKQMGEMDFTANGTAYNGIESFIIMDARVTGNSVITVNGLSGYKIVNQGEGSFGVVLSSPPARDTKFTYSSKF